VLKPAIGKDNEKLWNPTPGPSLETLFISTIIFTVKEEPEWGTTPVYQMSKSVAAPPQ